MELYEFSLGQTVRVVGHENAGIVVCRAVWESVGRPEPTVFYTVRFNKKELTFAANEVSAG